jgi:hypothetical protein
MFDIWAHGRADEKPPRPVTDLRAEVAGDRAKLTFTAPADEGGGKVVRYQVKCAPRPIGAYAEFLERFARDEDAKVANWWMAANLEGEPAPGAPGSKESFEVTGVPPGARRFAVVSYDDSGNASEVGAGAAAGE